MYSMKIVYYNTHSYYKAKMEAELNNMSNKIVLCLLITIFISIVSCNTNTGTETISIPITSNETAQSANILRDASSSNNKLVNSGVNVIGRGFADAKPDVAIINFSIKSVNDTASISRNKAAKGLQNILNALKAQNISEDNITTNFFKIGPEREWNEKTRKMEIIGFSTTNSVKVKIYQLENIGEIVDEIIINSDELIDFDSIGFELEDKTSIIKYARKMAVENAIEKAEEIATTAQIKLGSPTYITEISSPNAFENVSDMPMMAMARAESFVDTPIMSGDISVSVEVQIHFDIIDN